MNRERNSLRPFTALFHFGFFNAMTWMIALGTPMVLLAGQLGASTFEVGLAYSFVFLLLPLQILATAALPRFGYKRQVIFGWGARAVFLLPPMWLAWLAPEQPERWMAMVLVGSVFFFTFFRSLGSCGVMPWIYAIVPEHIRGRYFTTDQSLTGIAGILTLVLCALLFNTLPIYEAFFWQYVFAVGGAVLTLWSLARVADVPKPPATSVREVVTHAPDFCLKKGPFRQYLVYMLVANIAGTAFTPFAIYFLKVEAHIPTDRILFYNAFQYLGSIGGALLLRSRIDRFGVKPVFRFSYLANCTLLAYWLMLVAGYDALIPFLPLVYLGTGIYASHWIAAHLKYLPRVCPDDEIALAVSVHSSVVGVLGGIAPIVWGLILRESGSNAGMRTDYFAGYIFLLVLVQLGLFLYTGKLSSEHRDRPSLYTGAVGVRAVRFAGNLINLIRTQNEHGRSGNPSGPHLER